MENVGRSHAAVKASAVLKASADNPTVDPALPRVRKTKMPEMFGGKHDEVGKQGADDQRHQPQGLAVRRRQNHLLGSVGDQLNGLHHV